ncbi:MAG: L-threonylcarbamoyladenylate synthase [Frankiales bacterium]|nr:L-threonylcarbamoyladenylate synthase [Frankiales bacterium]
MTLLDCATPEGRERGIRLATDAVRGGGLIVLPTDTVYGVGADAFSARAVANLLEAKGRGRDMPPPVLVGSRAALGALVSAMPASGEELVDRFWPGPLTLVCRHTPHLAWDLGETAGTVAVRMPDHPLALDLLAATGPLAVSSANRTGMPAATTAAEAEEMLGGSVSIYLDGGSTAGTTPSTIVDLTGVTPRVLRSGALSLEELRTVAPDLLGPS